MSLQVWLPLTGDLHNQGLNNITVTNNGATIDNNGKIGKCYSFNGSNNCLKITNFNIGNEWSYGCWVYSPTSSRSWEGLIILNNNGGDADMQLGFYTCPTNTKIQSTANGQYNANISFTYNQWNHLFATFDGTNLKTYINGLLVNTKAITNSLLPRTNLTIGARCHGTDSYDCYFNGKINDVRIYDHCLSQKEVEEISKGLVLHYELNDRFCESTTNLCTSGTLGNNAYNAAINKYSYGTTTDMYKTTGVFQGKQATKVYMGTAGNSAYPYVWFDNIHPSQNQYKTLSFDYYPTSQTTLVFYTYNGSGTTTYSVDNGPIISGTWVPVKLNQWNHIVFTILGTSDKTSGWGYVRIGAAAHTSTTTDYWLFTNIQIEEKDHATGYVEPGGSRAATIIYDSSGYQNNGTIVGSLEVTTPSPRYSCTTKFDGVTSCIKIPYNEINPDRIFTVNLWFYKDALGSKGYETLFGGPSGFEMDTRAGTATSLSLYMASTRGSTVYSPLNLNKWTMITMARDGTNEFYYVDGELKKTIEAKSMPSGQYRIGAWASDTGQNYYGEISDFRIYATVLTAEQIRELYNTSMTIDNQGNIHTRELVEI